MSKGNRKMAPKRATHALLFFSFVLIGSAVLSMAKVTEIPAFGLIAISLGLMAAYAIFIWLVPATKLRLDIAADHMYYLGFLYTLSSLAVAITVSEPEKILSNFGVAIASTIFGIAARVAFNQMRIDPHDVEAASRVELSEATRRVSEELSETILQLTKFRTMSLQVMAEGYEDVQKNVENAAKDIFISLKDTSHKNAEVLMELGKNSSKEQAKLSESILNLKNSNEELITANKIMVSQISTAAEAFKMLANKYSDTNVLEGKIINEVKDSVGELQGNILNAVSKNLENAEKSFEDNVLQTMKENIGDQKNTLESATQLISEKLQKSIEANFEVSSRVLEVKKAIDAEKKNLKAELSGKKPRRWFRWK